VPESAEEMSSDDEEEGESGSGSEDGAYTVPIDIDEEPTIKQFLDEQDADDFDHPELVRALADSEPAARHTRTQVSLVDTTFGDIEHFLEGPETTEDAEAQEEYDKFLHGLRKVDNYSDRENSDDDEEYHEDDDAEAGMDEFRADLAVQISRRELEMLLRAANEDMDDEGDVEKESPRMAEAESKHRSFPAYGQLRPLVKKSSVAIKRGNFPMSPAQMQQHRTQLHEHMQLLVNIGLNARTGAIGQLSQKGTKLEQVAKASFRMICEIHDWRQSACDLKINRFRNSAQSASMAQQNARKIAASHVGGRTLRARPGLGGHGVAYVNALPSIYIPDPEHITVPQERQSTAFDVASLPLLVNAPVLTAFQENPLKPVTVDRAEQILQRFWNPFLKVNRYKDDQKKKKQRPDWTPAEDRLLVLGLELYGPHAMWNRIQKKLLPSYTPTQIHNRYKNQVSGNEKRSRKQMQPNPVRSMVEVMNLPLANVEYDLLKQGVANMGGNWKLISQSCMPYRCKSVLEKAWKGLCQQDPKLSAHTQSHRQHKRNTVAEMQPLIPEGPGEELPTIDTVWHEKFASKFQECHLSSLKWTPLAPFEMPIEISKRSNHDQ